MRKQIEKILSQDINEVTYEQKKENDRIIDAFVNTTINTLNLRYPDLLKFDGSDVCAKYHHIQIDYNEQSEAQEYITYYTKNNILHIQLPESKKQYTKHLLAKDRFIETITSVILMAIVKYNWLPGNDVIFTDTCDPLDAIQIYHGDIYDMNSYLEYISKYILAETKYPKQFILIVAKNAKTERDIYKQLKAEYSDRNLVKTQLHKYEDIIDSWFTGTHYWGTHTFNEKIDITDPCYDRGTWCAMNDVTIKPGKYHCKTIKVSDWGLRTGASMILHTDHFIKNQEPDWDKCQNIGNIGVDAGLAGFFNNKKDYTCKEWSDLCDKIHSTNELRDMRTYMLEDGFFSDTGLGDGGYDVYAQKENDQIIAVIIVYLSESTPLKSEWDEE